MGRILYQCTLKRNMYSVFRSCADVIRTTQDCCIVEHDLVFTFYVLRFSSDWYLRFTFYVFHPIGIYVLRFTFFIRLVFTFYVLRFSSYWYLRFTFFILRRLFAQNPRDPFPALSQLLPF